MTKSYRPISLLPMFRKIFERLIFNSMFIHFKQNNLFTKCQSGFNPGDSCVAQVLSITHEIYQSFACTPTKDINGIFLDIPKAFGKVWREGLLLNCSFMEQRGVFRDYLTGRQQRVALYGQTLS